MHMPSKKIVFISIPHIIVESEEARQERKNALPFVIASGNMEKSIVLDYSKSLESSPVKKGIFLKNISSLREKVKVLPADYEYIEESNQKVITHLRSYAPSVENPGAGEYYIDLTGTERLFGRELDTCGKILQKLKKTFGFTSCCGIGSTILIARLASEVAGAGGVYDIFDRSEKLFFPPLSIELLPDLSPSLKHELLMDYSIRRMGELLPFSKNNLIRLFGSEGKLLYNYSRGISRSTLIENKIEKKTENVLKSECIIDSENNDDTALRREFFKLVLELCSEMREECVVPQAAKIMVIYQDNYRYITAGKLKHPSFFEAALYEELVFYLNRALRRRVCIKKITLSFSRFTHPSLQLNLFNDTFRARELAKTFDLIRKRFGKKSIGYGA